VEYYERPSGDKNVVDVFLEVGQYLPAKKGSEAVQHAPMREPTSGLEPLTSSHYEGSITRCRDVQGVAKPAFLSCFLCSALLRVAPYCVPGGIRVVSGGDRLRLTGASPSTCRMPNPVM
jgi:hypothetical protein